MREGLIFQRALNKELESVCGTGEYPLFKLFENKSDAGSLCLKFWLLEKLTWGGLQFKIKAKSL
jgi:hypothetical protein